MRLEVVAALVSAGLLVSACATPTPKTEHAAATAAKPEQAAENNPMICGSIEVTGSRMPARECHTAAEWARMKSEGLDQFSLDAQRSLPSKGGN